MNWKQAKLILLGIGSVGAGALLEFIMRHLTLVWN